MEQGRFQGEQILAHQEGAGPLWGTGSILGVWSPAAWGGSWAHAQRTKGGRAAGAGGRVDGGDGPTEVTKRGDEDPHG